MIALGLAAYPKMPVQPFSITSFIKLSPGPATLGPLEIGQLALGKDPAGSTVVIVLFTAFESVKWIPQNHVH
jgi:hypothetical protein